MVTETATVTTQSYHLPMDAFQHVGISRHNILTNNRGINLSIIKIKYRVFLSLLTRALGLSHRKPTYAVQFSDKIHTLYNTKNQGNNNNNNMYYENNQSYNLHQATFSAGDQNLSLHDTEIKVMQILFTLYY